MQRSAALIGLVFLAAAGRASAVGSMADVSIHDRSSGRTLPVFSADGRYYVAGRPGNEYEIRIRNNTGTDLLAVVSVDGVNVVSGQTASPSQGGYVVSAGQAVCIAGWRKSLSRVAAFYFTDHSDAYATRTGRPDDVGVIGVAHFRSKTPSPVPLNEPPAPGSSPSSGAGRAPYQAGVAADADATQRGPAAAARGNTLSAVPSPEQSLGTGHGRSESSPARYATFERQSDTPDEVVSIGYDTPDNLVARGILPGRSARGPNPFPAQFVPDPPARW